MEAWTQNNPRVRDLIEIAPVPATFHCRTLNCTESDTRTSATFGQQKEGVFKIGLNFTEVYTANETGGGRTEYCNFCRIVAAFKNCANVSSVSLTHKL